MNKQEQKKRAEENRHYERILERYLKHNGLMPKNRTAKAGRHVALKRLYVGYEPSRRVVRKMGKYILDHGSLDGYRYYTRYHHENSFYSSDQWRSLRIKVLVNQGRKCCVCGRSASDGVKLHVDHIKPRSKHPELALVESNLQVLCEDCNLGKGNRYENRWNQKAYGK